jgi:L,D-peptidoglycan transpeptidase YkuD (ErfK/YbiS/YcfS/YnhG family)
LDFAGDGDDALSPIGSMRLISLSLFLLMVPMTAPAASDPLRNSRQCVVVVAPDWNSATGTLHAFERASATGDWKMRGNAIPVVLGKNGLGWGSGLVDTKRPAGPRKIEGDNKVPAGIFRLGPAFGYSSARSASWIKLHYVSLTKTTEGVDDPGSHYYNQLVDRSKVARVDWRSSEQMRRTDDLYKWGIFVAHNAAATPGAGSCIFMHIWKNSSTATTGCTAMAERDLVQLLRWIDPAAQPLLVQMPQADYSSFQNQLHLPALP